jgi:hypothetical protein
LEAVKVVSVAKHKVSLVWEAGWTLGTGLFKILAL